MLLAAIAFAVTGLAAPIQQPGDATVRAEISSHAAAVGQPVAYVVSVRTKSADDPQFEIPKPPAGLFIAGTSSSTEIEISMPGGRTNVSRQELQIVATRPGRYTLPATTVRIGRSVYRTEAIDLTITGNAAVPDASDSPVRLNAAAEPVAPYVGQQITLRLDALLPLDARYRPLRPPSYDPPSPSGFWIQDLPDPISAELRTIGGAQYEVQTYQRALFPLTPGSFTIPQGRLVYDLRGGVFFSSEAREALSDSLRVTVRPLPDAGRPAAFRGAVGQFTIAGGMDTSANGTSAQRTVPAGDALTFTMRVQGTGNIKSLPAPVFPEISGVDVYPPSEDATLRFVNAQVGGVRTFQWVLIPRKPGSLTIPAVQYAWFDPATSRYESAATAPVSLMVTPSAVAATAGGDTTLAPLRTQHGGGVGEYIFKRSFLLLQLVPLAILAIAFFMRRRTRGPSAAASSRRREVESRLVELESLSRSDARAFYAGAVRLLEQSRASCTVDSRNARADALASRLRASAYSEVQPDVAERSRDFADLHAVVLDMLGAPRTASSPAMLALALFVTTAASTHSADFTDGVRRFVTRDYTGAVESFERATQGEPSDAAAWYNLGNASYRAGDPGRAILGWTRALELQPRSADAMHNLRLLNASRAAAAVQRWFPVSSAELLVIAAAFWWVSLLVATGAILKPRAAFRNAAILSLTACVTALVMCAVRYTGPDAVLPLGRGAVLYGAPTTRTDVRGRLDVGDAASIIRGEGEWILVRTSNFTEGWVQKSAVGAL